jgi:hypothetical protein
MSNPTDPTVPTTPKEPPGSPPAETGGETNDIRPDHDTEDGGRGERNRSPERGRNRDNVRGH